MSSHKESEEEKPSASEQQPQGKNSPQNTPGAQNDSNVTQPEKSDEGDNNVKSQGGNQVKTGQNKTNATGTGGDADTKGSGGDNVKGQGGGDIGKDIPGDPKNEKNVSQTEMGQESGATGGGTSASIFVTRKRGRSGDPIHVGSSSGSGSKGTKKGKLEVPSRAPTCYVCKKTFCVVEGIVWTSESPSKANPRGIPPPTFTPEGSPEKKYNNKGEKPLKEQLAPALLNLARQTLQKMIQDSNTSVSAEVASSSRRGLDIDLNEPRTSVLLDLNDTPPPEKEDDEDNDD